MTLKGDLSRLMNSLGYQFSNARLLETALTHRSASSSNNERMEFLGDALLGCIIAEELYHRFPAASEGELSRMRASLVKGDTLAEIAASYQLGDYLNLGSGELKSGGYRRKTILADAFEAIIGAVYLDSDFNTVRNYVLAFYLLRLDDCNPNELGKDPKTRLQEMLQARGETLPSYKVVDIAGKTHDQIFTVSCTIDGMKEPAIASGSSRRRAEQAAAKLILDKLEQ